MGEKSTKAEREMRKHLRSITAHVAAFAAAMDVQMLGKSTPDRGRRISELVNGLELQNDLALRFGLGLERRGGKLRKVRR